MQNEVIEIVDVIFEGNTEPNVYDLCVSETHNYLVGLDNMIAHNSGVGRCYDDDMMLVNWDNAPQLRCVLSDSHPNFNYSAHESSRDAKHKYGTGKDVTWFTVPDTREGWAKAVEIWEVMAFEKIHKGKMLILDFSEIRQAGTPIKGMQNRPASGPVPLMNAFFKAASVIGAGLAPWLQALYVDHYFAECVLVGGARRSARIATKWWKDKTVMDFVTVKRPIEFQNLKTNDVIEYRRNTLDTAQSFLWSANNSIMVDKDFWRRVQMTPKDPGYEDTLTTHARKLFLLISSAAYADGTGEPGFINVDKLVQNNEGLDSKQLALGDYVGSERYQLNDDSSVYMSKLAKKALQKKYAHVVNPCSEISLHLLGGFCVVADVVPFHADTLDEAEEAFRVATRALMRINTMPSLYATEVKRTNRIGVSITGIHEFAWKFFKLGFRDLIDESKSQEFWNTLSRFNAAVQEESISYAKELGLVTPHTCTAEKPSGSVSKLFGLCEGWHLPSMAFYLRWVQFAVTDPLIKKYEALGYPIRKLTRYQDVVIVGFPTAPTISKLGLGDKLVVAGDTTPEELYKWLMLGEKYWIQGTDTDRKLRLPDRGNQISFTLRLDPTKVSLGQFRQMLRKYQSQVRCCALMPYEKNVSYEYQPEEKISRERYDTLCANIRQNGVSEDVALEHVDCESGACPVDFRDSK